MRAVYKWYADATVCYAFIEDCCKTDEKGSWARAFRSSRWFTRGWTLQELLAPQTVIFYDHDWNELGSKAPQDGKMDLADDIEVSAGISRLFTSGERSIQTASIAKRMSWAARRITSREEDLAYCLLGIFDINMPMLYGEGQNAFIRLQEEIMRASDDHTLFAWTDARITHQHGLLADSPSAFLESDPFVPFTRNSSTPAQPPLMTSRGLNITLGLLDPHSVEGVVLSDPVPSDPVLAMLDCGTEDGSVNHGYVGIFLTRTHDSHRHYARIECSKLKALETPSLTTSSIFVRQKVVNTERTPRPRHLIRPINIRGTRNGFPQDVLFLGDKQDGECRETGRPLALHVLGNSVARYPAQYTRSNSKVIEIPKGSGLLAAYVILRHPSMKQSVALLIGSNHEWELSFDAWKPKDRYDIDRLARESEEFNATAPMPQELREAFVPHVMGTRITKLTAFDITVEKLATPDEEEILRQASSSDIKQVASFQQRREAPPPYTPREEVVSLRITWQKKRRPDQVRLPSMPANEAPSQSHHKLWRWGQKRASVPD